MWPASAPVWLLLLGAERAELALVDRGRIVPASTLAQRLTSEGQVASAEALHGAVRALVAHAGAHSGARTTRLRVVISDRWLRWLTLPWSDQLLEPDAAAGLYNMHFGALLGATAAGMDYRAADAPYFSPRGVAGIERQLLAEINGATTQAGLSLVAVRPLSIVVTQALRAQLRGGDRALCVVEDAALTVAVIQQGRIRLVLTQANPADWQVDARRTWRRLRLREPEFESVGELCAIDLTQAAGAAEGMELLPAPAREPGVSSALQIAAAEWLPEALDFSQQAAPATGWRAALLAAGLVLGVASTAHAWLLHERLGAVAASAPRVAAVPSPRIGGSADARAAAARIHSVNEAIRALNMPVGSLLQAVETPKDSGVALLGVDFQGSSGSNSAGTVKISAEARGGSEMAAYVNYLAGSQPFKAVYLTRHEVAENQPAHPYRFTVEAAWQE